MGEKEQKVGKKCGKESGGAEEAGGRVGKAQRWVPEASSPASQFYQWPAHGLSTIF